MAKNRHYEHGNKLNLPVIAGTVSGGPVIVGMLPGVALTDRDAAGNASCQVGDGVYDVSVTGAITAIGQPVYITSTTYALGVAAGAGAQVWGHALALKSAGAAVIPVRIAPYSVAVGTPA
jgi:predicted RecA/RadA family phage recombinase